MKYQEIYIFLIFSATVWFVIEIYRYIIYIKIGNEYYLRNNNIDWNLKYINKLRNMKIQNEKFGLYSSIDNKKINIPILYLNLDRGIDRKNKIEEELNSHSVNYVRISAIDGKEIKNMYKDQLNGVKFINNYNTPNRRYKNTKLEKAEIGCTMAHLKAIRYAYNNGLDIALILEDDCTFAMENTWDKTLEKIVEDVPRDWGIIQTHGLKCNTFSNECVQNKKPCWSALSYLISRKGMEDILSNCLENWVKGKKIDDEDTFILGLTNPNVKDKVSFNANGTLFLQNRDKYLYPNAGVADQYIYALTTTYYCSTPILIPTLEYSFIRNNFSLLKTQYLENKKIINHINKYNKIFLNLDDCDKQFKLAQTLSDFKSECDDKHIIFRLDGDTLLGYYIEKKFIGNNVYVAIDVLNNFESLYSSNIFKLVHKFKYNDILYGCVFKHNDTHKKIVCLIYYPEDDGTRYTYLIDAENVKHKVNTHKYSLSEISFIKRTFNAPDDIEQYLTDVYGSNWNLRSKHNGILRSIVDKDNSFQKHDLWPARIDILKKPLLWIYVMPDTDKEETLNSVKKNGGEIFDIIVLDDDMVSTISRNVDLNFRNINPLGMRSEYIGMCLVEEYGGIWVDTRTSINKGLNIFIETLKTYNFVGTLNSKGQYDVGIFGGNKNNRISKFFKYVFENHKDISKWKYRQCDILSLGSPNVIFINVLKDINKTYPKECMLIRN